MLEHNNSFWIDNLVGYLGWNGGQGEDMFLLDQSPL